MFRLVCIFIIICLFNCLFVYSVTRVFAGWLVCLLNLICFQRARGLPLRTPGRVV